MRLLCNIILGIYNYVRSFSVDGFPNSHRLQPGSHQCCRRSFHSNRQRRTSTPITSFDITGCGTTAIPIPGSHRRPDSLSYRYSTRTPFHGRQVRHLGLLEGQDACFQTQGSRVLDPRSKAIFGRRRTLRINRSTKRRYSVRLHLQEVLTWTPTFSGGGDSCSERRMT